MTEMKMGKCWMEGCYEQAEIMFTSTHLEDMLDEAKQLPHTLSHTLAGYYLFAPQPAAEDIASVKVERRGTWFVATVKIRRGKEMLAEFFNSHDIVESQSRHTGIDLTCRTCGRKLEVSWDSLGFLGGPLVKEAIKGSHETACLYPRTVRRTVGGDSGGSESERGDGRVHSDSSSGGT